MSATFDESLPALMQIIISELGVEWSEHQIFLRDANGLLYIVIKEPLSQAVSERLNKRATEYLPDYINSQLGVIVTADDLNEPSAIEQARPMLVPLNDSICTIKLIDRRIIGQDWSAIPTAGWRPPQAARFVFWSLKGGVGRSTALAVAATDFARQGKRVLAVDLDLEAPGIGSILLDDESLPVFGTLDWYVEYDRSTMKTDSFLDEMVAPSSQTAYSGILHVAPAIGSRGKRSPENAIPKLGRAYLESVTNTGSVETFGNHTQRLINQLQIRNSYDLILVDARAGLNETTAASLLGLGADVLMFAENTPQSFDGYRYLLAHLRGLPINAIDDDWRLRFKMVHAKAEINESRLFNDRSFSLFSEFLYEQEIASEGFNFDIDDPDAPHVPWVIADDSRYRSFEPLRKVDQLSERVYYSTFGDLIAGIRDRINVTGDSSSE